MRQDEKQLVRPASLVRHSDQPSDPPTSISRMLEKMGFPDPEGLRQFIIGTPWGINNRRPMIYLQHLSAQGKSLPFLSWSILVRTVCGQSGKTTSGFWKKQSNTLKPGGFNTNTKMNSGKWAPSQSLRTGGSRDQW